MVAILVGALAVMGVVNGAALLVIAYRFWRNDGPEVARPEVARPEVARPEVARPTAPRRVEDEPAWTAYAAQLVASPRVAPVAVHVRLPGAPD